MFDSHQLKKDFPILSRSVHERPLVYLDNAATSQKPQIMIDAIAEYYQQHNANVHRGVHVLSEEATDIWETSRQTIAHFFGATNEELILTRNTTEGINGVAYGWADNQLQPGDIILTSLMEHHSNFVVWQEVCKRTGAKLEFISMTQEGRLDLEDFKIKIQQPQLRLIALSHVSNTLGTVNPISDIVELVTKHKHSAQQPIRVLIDGAQSAPHQPINFDQLGVDFFVFSGHKMLGPMGIGGLLVKKELVDTNELRPWLFGGGMIQGVFSDHATYSENAVDRFTAGTPDVASAVGLAASCQYLTKIGMQQVLEHDQQLVDYTIETLSSLPQIQLVGPTQAVDQQPLDRLGSVAFLYQGVHAHDVAQIVDSEGVAVRSGHHCCMPLHTHFGWAATTRASFQVYNTPEDIDQLIYALKKVGSVFRTT